MDKYKKYNFYKILKIKNFTEVVEIRKAYRKRILEVHPDKEGGSVHLAQLVNFAKEILFTEKYEYDFYLRGLLGLTIKARQPVDDLAMSHADIDSMFDDEFIRKAMKMKADIANGRMSRWEFTTVFGR